MYNFYPKIVQPPGRMNKFLMIMKITTLIMVTVILHVSATSLAQKISLSERNAPLSKVFDEISNQTGYDFAYTSKALEDTKSITINVKNEELKNVLDKIFAGQPVNYSIEDKWIIVSAKQENVVDKPKAVFAQVPVSGKVVDDLGQPMIGVTITEKGTKNVTTTTAKGSFNLTATDDNSILVFSYVGFESKEIPVKQLAGGSVITLVPAVTNLREVAINKGYYFERQELTTGDVSTVDSKTIGEQPGVDAITALEGRVPGLYIRQASGLPGANENVQLRGQNSIANGNNPLYIIDGVPFGSVSPSNPSLGTALGVGSTINFGNSGMSPLSVINPKDIDNIEVLKDADATAIYGSRGANGVILITTKKGRMGDTRVNFDLSQGMGDVTRMMHMMNTPQYLQMRKEALKNDGLLPTVNDPDINGAWDTTRYTNWQKALIGNTAHYTNAQISVSGGTENTQFNIGGGYSRQTTVFPGDYSDKKGSFNFNLTHSSSNKRFQLQFSGSYLNDNNNLPLTDLTTIALELAPDAPPLYTSNGALNWQPVGGTATFPNPLSNTLRSANAVVNNLISNLTLSYKILPGLIIKSNLGYTNETNDQSNQTPAISFPPPNNTNPNNRNNSFGNTHSQTWIIEPQLNYYRKIGKAALNVLIGTTFQQNNLSDYEITAIGFNSDALIINPLNASTKTLGSYDIYEYRYNSVYGRLNYTWDDKYLLNVTARRDGSSRFGPANEYGNFGAIGTGWIFTKEDFFKNYVPWLNFGKLRASYGITGNDQIADYQYLSAYTTNTPTYQGATGLYPTRIPNPYYGWETDRKLEFGLELGFLNDRISLITDYFRNRTGNQLVGYTLPSSSGFTTVQENLPAVVQNKGEEFEIHTVNIKLPNFSWSSSFNLTIPENKLISYPGLATSSYVNHYEIGQSLFISKVYDYLGVDPQTGASLYKSNKGPTSTPSTADEIFSNPYNTQQYYGGFQNSFQYKNFQLDVFLQFAKQTGRSALWTLGYFAGRENYNQPTAMLNHWQSPGEDAAYGKYSTMLGGDPSNLITNSTAMIVDASFIRLKNVALSYKLPKTLQQSLHLQNARIYLQAQNLFTITNYFGLDPENLLGNFNLPPLRMISAGISASF